MEFEGAGVTQPDPRVYTLRLKFGDDAFCEVEIQAGEDAAAVAKKLRELAEQVGAQGK